MRRNHVRNLLSIIVAACFAIAAAGFVELADGPYLGLAIAEGARLKSIEGIPIEPDYLIEDPDYLGDRRAIEAFFAFQNRSWSAVKAASERDAPLRVVLATEGDRPVTVDAIPERMGFARAMGRTWLMLLLGFFSLASGYILAMRRPDDPNALRFFAMTLSVELIFSSFGIYTARDLVLSPPVFRALFAQNTVAFVSFFCFFPWFFLHFPARKPFLERKASRIAAYAIAALATVAGVSRIFGSLSNAFFLIALLVGSGALLHAYATAKSLVERYQVRWILLGTVAFATVFCATAIVPSLLTGHRLLSDKVPSLFFALIPLSILASIEKYRLMDIDGIVDASLAYLGALAIVAALDVLVIYLLLNYTPLDASSSIITTSIFVCLAFSLAYAPLRALTLKAVKVALRRPEVDSVSAMLGASSRLGASSSPGEALSAFGAFLVEAFGSREACLEAWLEGRKVLEAPDSPLGPSIGLDALRNLPREPAYLRAFMTASLPPEQVDSVYIPVGDLVEREAAPVRDDPEFYGYVVLSRRALPSMYSRADLALLRALAQECTHFVAGLLARDRARKAETSMLLEKERISRDIHDGLGGALGTSLMLLDGLSPEASEEDRARRRAELRRLLDDGLGELRALVWTMNDDESDVEALALVIRDRLMPPLRALGYRCSVSVGEGSGALALPSRIRMGVYRIAQEFITNCAKHSMPGRLEVSFEPLGSALRCRFSARAAPRPAVPGDADNLRGGNGTLNTERRAAELGACLESETRGDERRLTVTIPLAEPELQPGPGLAARV